VFAKFVKNLSYLLLALFLADFKPKTSQKRSKNPFVRVRCPPAPELESNCFAIIERKYAMQRFYRLGFGHVTVHHAPKFKVYQ
jgi:hypothetical protein